jgi:hypothetical protein
VVVAAAVAAAVSDSAAARLRNIGGNLAAAWWRWQRRWRQRDSATAAAALRRRGGGVAAVAARRRRTARRRQAMDGARARAIDGVKAMLRRRNARWLRDGDRRPVIFDDIEIEDEARLVIPLFRNLFFGPKNAFLTGFLRIFFLLCFPEEFFGGTWFWRGRRNSCFFPISQEFFAGIPVRNSCIYSGFLRIPEDS